MNEKGNEAENESDKKTIQTHIKRKRKIIRTKNWTEQEEEANLTELYGITILGYRDEDSLERILTEMEKIRCQYSLSRRKQKQQWGRALLTMVD
ncbi:hypothetical protein JTB14_023752 [Gonioctena quinquepunctata]|nr:hypothetical protein JTB14_023752 [Gonioctena quinquepunctata]